ncbi:uncharacterized protein UDID_11469 [Ustilago sp. UG-2017a]|nr:uncharacterized protein UDID_11469 [Ustilago sp. UG-2017a]
MTPPDRLEIRSIPPRTIGKSSQKLTADTRQRCREPETYMYPSSALNTLESDDGSCQSGVIHYPTPANERSRTRRAAVGTCILLPSEESRSRGVRECLNSRNQLANLLAQLTAYPTATVANLSQQQMAPRPFFCRSTSANGEKRGSTAERLVLFTNHPPDFFVVTPAPRWTKRYTRSRVMLCAVLAMSKQVKA